MSKAEAKKAADGAKK